MREMIGQLNKRALHQSFGQLREHTAQRDATASAPKTCLGAVTGL
jgi:hypothetical protein